MDMQETIKAKGRIKFDLFDASGALKETKEINNVVVTVGKNYMAAWLAAASQAGYFMQYIGLGEGVAAANVTDTDLASPLATRVAGTITSSTNVWQNVALFGPGVDTGAITESGIFSASTSGTLMARQTFGVINKAAGDSLQVTWQITLS
jgi:hypothetical protein